MRKDSIGFFALFLLPALLTGSEVFAQSGDCKVLSAGDKKIEITWQAVGGQNYEIAVNDGRTFKDAHPGIVIGFLNEMPDLEGRYVLNTIDKGKLVNTQPCVPAILKPKGLKIVN